MFEIWRSQTTEGAVPAGIRLPAKAGDMRIRAPVYEVYSSARNGVMKHPQIMSVFHKKSEKRTPGSRKGKLALAESRLKRDAN